MQAFLRPDGSSAGAIKFQGIQITDNNRHQANFVRSNSPSPFEQQTLLVIGERSTKRKWKLQINGFHWKLSSWQWHWSCLKAKSFIALKISIILCDCICHVGTEHKLSDDTCLLPLKCGSSFKIHEQNSVTANLSSVSFNWNGNECNWLFVQRKSFPVLAQVERFLSDILRIYSAISRILLSSIVNCLHRNREREHYLSGLEQIWKSFEWIVNK